MKCLPVNVDKYPALQSLVQDTSFCRSTEGYWSSKLCLYRDQRNRKICKQHMAMVEHLKNRKYRNKGGI